ncbi:MAG: ABC transporter permease [Acidobacteria bacterium]|nr:ABC transporter permease [Acidobacteriota bacterium]
MAQRDDRLQEELQFHLEQQIAKNIRSGMSPDEARRSALVKFGGVEPVREAARDQLRGAWLADLARDMRMTFRALARVPAFAVTAILTFALGIGAASAMFSVYEGVLLRPLPYPESHRIAYVYQLNTGGVRNRVADPNFDDWRAGTRSFKAMAQISAWGAIPIAGAGDAQLARMTRVSKDFFDALGVAPVLGRAFLPEEQQPGGPPVAVVSASFWRRWRGDAQPSGEVIRSGSDAMTVVGVMPEGFDFPGQTSIWMPRELSPQNPSRTSHNSLVVARLADGATLAQANSDISALSRALKAQHGDRTWMEDAEVVPMLEVITAASRSTLGLLFAASILLLIVATINVSNLLVVRASARRTEFAVQLALGATAGRLGRQQLAESMVLCLVGAALGVAGAMAAVRLFVAAGPAAVARLETIQVSWPAVAFAVTLSMLAAVILSVVTVLGAKSTHVSAAIGGQGRSGTSSRRQARIREGLIVAQVAMTLVLLAGAALLGRSLMAVMSVDPGFSLEDGLVVELTIPGDGSPEAGSRQVAFQDAAIERLQQQPGVTKVGLVTAFPLGVLWGANGSFIEMTRPDEITTFKGFNRNDPVYKARTGSAEYRHVSGDYFGAMRIPLLEGRLIDGNDGPDSPQVAVVSESLVKARWPDRSALGRWIQFGNMDGDLRGIQVVGVVGDVREVSPESRPSPTIYVSARQRPRQAGRAWVVVKGPASTTLAETARRVVREIDPEVPVAITTVSAAVDTALNSRRFTLWLVGAFGAAALILAALGVYGLISFAVSQRRREMGIRMALGAEPRSLVLLVVRRGLVLAAVGAAIGVGLSKAGASALDGLLYNVTPGDPLTIGAVVLTMLVVATAASYAPARRILKQTPGRTLHDV